MSQESFAQFLSKKIEGRQFIDTGTVSRWERRINTPSFHNQIYILRKLRLNVCIASLLSEPEDEYGHEQAIKLLQNRFNRFSGLADKPYRITFPRFKYTESNDVNSFLNDKILREFNNSVLGVEFLNSNFLHVLLLEVDHVRIIKFYRDGQIVGHTAYATIYTEKLVKFLAQYCKSSIHSHLCSDIDGKILLNFSSYASDFSLYLFYVYHMIKDIELDPKIDWYVGHSFINDDWQIQKKLGAKLMACGKSAEQGGVKIGKSYTDSVMFSTSASTLLSSSLSALKEEDIFQYADIVKLTQ
ncbi:hypothetical protein [Shewanella sp.]|uniref:hypothetical protein n=1 Tax=Shewanella sp. TaxID=50422 RepID=UPI003A8BA78F